MTWPGMLSRHQTLWLFVLLSVVYLILHIPQLTLLPIFADEAIYIRWAQLILDDPGRYLFFPLNDGKTPLFIWGLVPWLRLGLDPLWISRLISVVGGLVTMWLLGLVALQLRLRRGAILVVLILGCVLPFWFFNARLALMDTWMSAWLTASLLAVVMLLKQSQQSRRRLLWMSVLGVSVALALWTKLSALIWLPTLFVWPWYLQKVTSRQRLHRLLFIGCGVGIGVVGFLILKIAPTFPQLFSRGSDFLFSPAELLAQPLSDSIRRVFSYATPLLTYLTPFVCLAPFLGLAFTKQRRLQLVLLLAIVLFLLPILMLGQVVYSRYLLPTSILFSISTGVLFHSLLNWFDAYSQLWQKAIIAVVVAGLLGSILSASSQMIWAAYTDITALPLTVNDRFQYLLGWSAGYGTKEVAQTLLKSDKNTRIVVATEGFFGSLPDGLLVYLHRQPITNVFVDGIGQPVEDIPDAFKEKVLLTGGFDQAWLVVNSHRLSLPLEVSKRLARYCRPDNGPCLDVYDITGEMSQ